MQVPTDVDLLEHIEAFLKRTGMRPTRFGIEATGEGGLIKSLRDGRSLTLKSVQRLIDFMAEYDAAQHGHSDTPAERAGAPGKSDGFAGCAVPLSDRMIHEEAMRVCGLGVMQQR
jgi:hypothetical protein